VVGRAGDIVGELDARTQAIAELVETRGGQLTEALAQRTAELAGRAESASNLLSQAIDGKVGEIEQRFDQARGIIVEALDRKGRDLTEAVARQGIEATRVVTDVRERLSQDVGTLLERLTEANLTLHGVMNRAAENLDLVEKNLGGRTDEARMVLERTLGETRSVTEAMAGQIATLKDSVMGDVSELALRFETQTRTLNDAVHLIGDANRALETTVEERRQALESLAAGLFEKTRSVEGLMNGFTSLIADTLNAAEARARDVGAALTSSADEAMHRVVSQLETMRDTAGTEGQRSAEALRTAQEAMIGEMTRAVSETTARFADATEKMREAARIMQAELEATRGELRRGVLELPEETEKSTANLRRIVTDQLRALSELSSLVGRQNAHLDVSRPSAAPAPRAAAPAPAPAPVAEPSRWEAAPRRPAAAAIAESQWNEPRRAEPAPAPQPPSYGSYARTAPTPAPAPTAEEPAEAGRGGWVSDLLRRASRDEEPAAQSWGRGGAAATSGDNLNALAGDIARGIDDAAYADAWERHDRGERAAFSRRLYTVQGQQTFEEIRRKYQRDADFRTAVDRYVGDFETLLDDAGRSRDPDVARTYLASDTGKVYTMFAHVAGRLG
jgi:hypothetical protein